MSQTIVAHDYYKQGGCKKNLKKNESEDTERKETIKKLIIIYHINCRYCRSNVFKVLKNKCIYCIFFFFSVSFSRLWQSEREYSGYLTLESYIIFSPGLDVSVHTHILIHSMFIYTHKYTHNPTKCDTRSSLTWGSHVYRTPDQRQKLLKKSKHRRSSS